MIALLILAVLALEAVVLILVWHRKQRGLQPRQTLCFLGAGAGFALALYGALTGAGAVWMGISLTAAFLFHLADLMHRWR
ncbi:MAG: hypothetical protein AAFO61_06805 [Pseudomonadota bacterium]